MTRATGRAAGQVWRGLAVAAAMAILAAACPPSWSAGVSPEIEIEDELVILFEPWSNKLAADEKEHLDQLAVRYRQRPDARLVVYVPQRKDPGTRRFVASRIAAIDRELAKRGLAVLPAPAPVAAEHENGISLRALRLIPNRAPLPLLPPVARDVPATLLAGPAAQEQELSGWQVRAAVPGRAWVTGPGEQAAAPAEIREGQNHPKLGQVERVAEEGGRWTVRTSSGWFGGGP